MVVFHPVLTILPKIVNTCLFYAALSLHAVKIYKFTK